MTRAMAAAVLLLTMTLTWPGHAEGLSGPAAVIDGDTIHVGGNRVRLHGVDAPEGDQTCIAGDRRWHCGEYASRALADLIGSRTVDCKETARDRYGRIVAVCRLGLTDLSAWLAAEGWAVAYRRYSTAYVSHEHSARSTRRGIWRGRFVLPWDWRAGVRLSNGSRASDGKAVRIGGNNSSGKTRCAVKGNIGRNGERIYHVPGGQYYERTRISASKGERWFCSEAEARSAGWRKSKR